MGQVGDSVQIAVGDMTFNGQVASSATIQCDGTPIYGYVESDPVYIQTT